MKRLNIEGPRDAFALVVRRKNWILVSFALVFFLVALLTVLLPAIYVSSTLILVQPRDVPSDVVKEFVTSDTQQRLTSIQETVLSRTNLLRIINQFPEGFQELRKLSEIDQVERMRSRIQIEVTSERNRRDPVVPYFNISYGDTVPEVAQRVTGQLAALFIEHDARTRELQVFGTADFLRNELQKVAVQLEEQETRLAQLKEQYRYELPDQLEANLRTLDRLQGELKSNSESYDRYVSLKLDVERQIAETPPLLTREMQRSISSPKSSSLSSQVAEYKKKEQTLNEFTSRYTDQHPDVKRLKAELERLRSLIPPEDLVEIEPLAESQVAQLSEPNPVYQKLVSQLRQVTTELEILKQRRAWLEGEALKYARRVENTPQREQQIASVQRRFDDLDQQYQKLKQDLNDAEMARSLENRQKGEQFQIVDPASYPLQPAKPNRILMLLIGFFGALAFSLALAVGVDFVDQRIWSYTEIEKLLGVPVIAEIPEILSQLEADQEKRLRRLWGVSLISLYGLCAVGFLVVYSSGWIRAAGSEFLIKIVKW